MGQSFFNYEPDDALLTLRASFEQHWTHHSDALLQHYGVPSRALDITDDPLSALWFASNSFELRADHTACFTPSVAAAGVVYVIQNPATADVVNLQLTTLDDDVGYPELDKLVGPIPYYGLRGVAQKGLLLFGATTAAPDLRPAVAATIHLTPGNWSDEVAALGFTYPRMIPPPKEDRFYACLLAERANATSPFTPVVRHVIPYT